MENESFELLLVDDDEDDIDLILHALRGWNTAHRIRIARDGVDALEILFGKVGASAARPLPRLVLLDLKMPRIGGIEVLRAIRADRLAARLPVVILTSSAEERDILEAYDHGANSFVVKPVRLDQFEEAVRQIGAYWLLLNHSPASG